MKTGVRGRDEERHDPCGRAGLRTEPESALVAMMAVRDEQASALEGARIEVGKTPEPRAARLEVGRTVRELGVERSLQEQKDGLRLDARRAQQVQPLIANTWVCSLVRQDVSRLVRLGRERDDDPAALPPDPVRADVLLREKPHGGFVLMLQDPVRKPVAVQLGRLLRQLGQRQVDDVVRAAREELLAFLATDGVIGRGDEIGERSGRAGVANGAKRLQVAHRGERTNALPA